MELCGSEVECYVSLIPLCATALMPHSLHIQMTSRQRRTLRQLRHDPRLRPRERDRVEMCLLSAQGWTAPRLAVHLDVCAATVRRWIRQWEARGLKSLRYARMGRPPAVAQRQQVFRALRRCLRRPQVWSSRTLSAALATQGLHLQPRTVRKYLRLMGASYQRTKSCLRHKQDPERVAVARAELQAFKKKPAPAISSSFTWTKADSRPLCPPPIPGADPAPAPTSPTKTRKADA